MSSGRRLGSMTQHLYRKQHIVTSVVAVITDDHDRVVLTRRSIAPFQDLWVMPGGKIDLGEPILRALHREVREEIGIDVTVGALVDVFEHLTPGLDRYHFVILYYRCRALQTELAPNPTEVSEARWVRRDELARLAMPEGTRQVLRKVFTDATQPDDPSPPPSSGRPATVRMLATSVDLDFPVGQHLHCLVAQLPIRLRRSEQAYAIEDREGQWDAVRSVLDLVGHDPTFRKLHLLVLPESAVPAARFDDALALAESRLHPNAVVMMGLEHVPLRTYREILGRFRDDNAEAIDLVQRDLDAGAAPEIPVNWCCVAVKEATGRLRVFLEAKSHPFHGEEFPDKFADLYRGRHFYVFRAPRSCFNFMVLICLDYLYRDPYGSNVRQIIDHANRLYFATRQPLDALFVIQCNPKPEHRAYWEVLSGFYGEYLEATPGVRDTVTVFGNSSEESAIEGCDGGTFGVSSVVIGRRHKLARLELSEFSTDDFGGAPLCRLRFGKATRLYYFNLPLQHEVDPRSVRIPLKVHLVLGRTPEGRWSALTGARITEQV